jgi:hypothetical protein
MTMHHLLYLTILGVSLGAAPAWPQDRTHRPPTPSGEIQIPSEKMLEREAFTTPGNPFSTNDATALKQMDQRDKQIDREVEKGICVGC